MSSFGRFSACVAFFTAGLLMIPSAGLATGAGAQPPTWVAAWAASPTAPDADPREPLLNLEHQTVREHMRLSVGGSTLRVRLSNEYGSTPLTIGAATVGLTADAGSVQPGSLRPLTFEGRSAVTIPAGTSILSDTIALTVNAGGEISISLYFPQRVSSPTLHSLALKDAIVTPPGDASNATQVQAKAISKSSISVSQVLTWARTNQRLVATFGDSLVDGDHSTFGADRSWPSDLARRLRATRGGSVAVANAGIAGNRLLADGPLPSLGVSGLERFERDVLSLPGLTHVIISEGINDIGFPGANLQGFALADPAKAPSVNDMIAGYRRLIASAHARGVKVIGATLTPFQGVDVPGYYSRAKNDAREAINHWIRASGEFDAVIDFDAVVRDPNHPAQLAARYASSDHLHPNDGGYQAMADAIELDLFDDPGRPKSSTPMPTPVNGAHSRI